MLINVAHIVCFSILRDMTHQLAFLFLQKVNLLSISNLYSLINTRNNHMMSLYGLGYGNLSVVACPSVAALSPCCLSVLSRFLHSLVAITPRK